MFWILDSRVGMNSGDEISEYATVRTPVSCRLVRLPTRSDYDRNVPIMLESVLTHFARIMLDISKALYARHYAGVIRPSLSTTQFFFNFFFFNNNNNIYTMQLDHIIMTLHNNIKSHSVLVGNPAFRAGKVDGVSCESWTGWAMDY